MDDPDVALMQAFARGQENAFVELYNRHRDRILRYSRRMLRDDALAEEATQDVFLKLYRARDAYSPRSRFSTYLFRIATNHCINLRARVEHRLRSDEVEVAEQPTRERAPDLGLDQQRLRAQLDDALRALPERQRAALLLVHHEGLSYREAATAVEVSEGAIKSLVHRARSTMIEQLGPLLTSEREWPDAV